MLTARFTERELSSQGNAATPRTRSLSPRYRARREPAGPSSSPRLQSGSLGRNSGANWALPTASKGSEFYLGEGTIHQQEKRRTPVFTIMLLRLDENFKAFCDCLSNPTPENAAKAASLLDTSVVTATSPTVSPQTRRKQYQHVSNSASALESEWDKYASPFLILAAAEAFYSEMKITALTSMYSKIMEDLALIKISLCDPCLSPAGPNQEVAESVSAGLESLGSIASFRFRLITMQQSLMKLIAEGVDGPSSTGQDQGPQDSQPLMASASSGLEECLQTCARILGEIPENPSCYAKSMLESLRLEVRTWVQLLETGINLQHRRFQQTILHSRKLKGFIAKLPCKESALGAWFTQCLTKYLEILPIYFDRTRVETAPMCGFDLNQSLLQKHAQNEIEVSVQEMLRKLDGSSPASVMIFWDEAAASKSKNDRSHHPRHWEDDNWSVVYMRTSTSSGVIAKSPSISNSLSTRLLRRIPSANTEEKMMEAPKKRGSSPKLDEGNKPSYDENQWPLSEKQRFLPVLRAESDGVRMGPACTHRLPNMGEEASSLLSPLSPMRGHGPAPFQKSPFAPLNQRNAWNGSVLHLVGLSNCLWMAVAIKCEDNDSKWNLRRSRGQNDEEVRAFLNEMARGLRVAAVFPQTRRRFSEQQGDGTNERGGMFASGLIESWNVGSSQGFLQKLKGVFGLRSQRRVTEHLPFLRNIKKKPIWKSSKSARDEKKTPMKNHMDSAFAFFLGPDLAANQG